MTKKLTTRLSKGKLLTHEEMDANFEILSEVQSGNSRAIETALLNLQTEVATLKTENSILRQQVNTNNNAIIRNAQEISTIGQQISSLDDSLPISTYNPESIDSISEKENTLSPNEVTISINTITETDEETQEETTYQEVEYVPAVSPIIPQEQISIPTVSDPDDTTDDIEPITTFDYQAETELLLSEISRIKTKILGTNISYGIVWGFLTPLDLTYPGEENLKRMEIYQSTKATYDTWVLKEYDWDNRTGEFQQIDTYPYRYNISTPQYSNIREETINYPWKYASYPPTFVDISANNTTLTDYIGVRSASTRITNSLVDQHVNNIPVGVLFAQQYSKYMYGMWDENSELSIAVDREIQAYNALATLDIWDDIKRFVHSSNILGLFAWMNPIKESNYDGPTYNNLITNTDHIDLLIEWANAKLEILNLVTKKSNFTTEFTWDIISTLSGGLLAERRTSTGAVPIGATSTAIYDQNYRVTPQNIDIQSPGTVAHIRYLNAFRQIYGYTDFHMGTNVTFSKMNRLFMDGTTYDSWNSVVSNSKLYSEENPQFSTDTSLIYGTTSIPGTEQSS